LSSWFVVDRREASRGQADDEGVQILELARNAQALFERQTPREKRHLLNFVLSNCSWHDGKVVATFRQPFDWLAEPTATAAHLAAGPSANSKKRDLAVLAVSSEWLSAVGVP
jgi:site-specific DNA recombinase